MQAHSTMSKTCNRAPAAVGMAMPLPRPCSVPAQRRKAPANLSNARHVAARSTATDVKASANGNAHVADPTAVRCVLALLQGLQTQQWHTSMQGPAHSGTAALAAHAGSSLTLPPCCVRPAQHLWAAALRRGGRAGRRPAGPHDGTGSGEPLSACTALACPAICQTAEVREEQDTKEIHRRTAREAEFHTWHLPPGTTWLHLAPLITQLGGASMHPFSALRTAPCTNLPTCALLDPCHRPPPLPSVQPWRAREVP